MTTWTKITKSSGTSWTEVPKATSTTPTITGGSPIGLLLALTYSTVTNVTDWTKITKASSTSWTNIPKAS